MATKSAASFVTFVSLFLALILTPARGCSPIPGGNPPIVDDMGLKMYKSEITILGVGQRAIVDQRYEKVYSMEVEVKCVYKKPEDVSINAMITVHDIGEVPGLCVATNITTGQLVIIYLTKDSDTVYRPTFSSDPGSSQHREELMSLCEFNPEYATGLDVSTLGEEECEVDYEYQGDCHDPTDVDEPIEPPIGPVEPEIPPPPPATEEKMEPAAPTKKTTEETPKMDDMGDKKKVNVTAPEMDKGKDKEMDADTGSKDKGTAIGDGDDEGKDVPYERTKEAGQGNTENSAMTFVASVALLGMSLLSVAIL